MTSPSFNPHHPGQCGEHARPNSAARSHLERQSRCREAFAGAPRLRQRGGRLGVHAVDHGRAGERRNGEVVAGCQGQVGNIFWVIIFWDLFGLDIYTIYNIIYIYNIYIYSMYVCIYIYYIT